MTPQRALIQIFAFAIAIFVNSFASAETSDKFIEIRRQIDEFALEKALSSMKVASATNAMPEIELTLLSAMFFAESGQPGKALQMIDKAEFMTTGYASELSEVRARAFFKQGDFAKADDYAAAAIQSDKSNRAAYLIELKVDGELTNALQEEQFENLLRASSNDRSVWFAYLEQALRFSPNKTELADRAYVVLGDTGILNEYRARFAFQGGDRYDAYQLFREAQRLYINESNTISANRIGRWLKINGKYANRPAEIVEPKKEQPTTPKKSPKKETPDLERKNLPAPTLTPASQGSNLEIEPIALETDGDIYTGSGFITNRGKWIITNRHVVEGAERAVVRDGLGKVRYVKEYYLDEEQDIALLVLHDPFPENQAVIASDIIDPVGGDELFLMGYPLASVLGAHHPSITEGIVSKEAGFDNEPSEFLITANLNQGNSGGPIFSVDGRVLGIAVAKLDKIKFLEESQTIPEDVNIGIKGASVRKFLDFKGTPSTDARPIMSPRDAYSSLRSKVVLIVAIDE